MRVRLTLHALEKMHARNVTLEEIELTVRKPTVSYTSRHEHMVYQRGSLAVVVAQHHTDEPVIVTLLLRSERAWSDDDARNRDQDLGERELTR